MTIIIKKNYTKNEIICRNWNFHPAFFHFKNFKNAYINGKPLKPYHILRNSDVIEIVERPAEFISNLFSGNWLSTILGIATLGFTGFVLFKGLTNQDDDAATPTTLNKEYSSTTQPELKGSQNSISDGMLPILFGKTQQTPSYGQLPYRLVQDGTSTNKYRQYFIPNYNNVVYSDFKLGETSVNDYSIDYLSIRQSLGSSTFIGFENVKSVTSDEELSYNADEAVSQSSNYNYNVLLGIDQTALSYSFILKFENVDISNFSTKTFKANVEIRYLISNPTSFQTTVLTHDFAVSTNDIIQSGDDYIYNGSCTWDISNLTDVAGSSFSLVSSQFAATSKTRNNAAEIDNELNCILEEETITSDSSSWTTTLNASVNNYSGTMSEVINTSPENTTEIDVILSFPQGLYNINSSNGERKKRLSIVEITYKGENDNSWQPISNATALYIRDVNGVKQPLNTSTTTVNGAKVTVESPDDLNVADQLFFRPIGFELPQGKYSVRVRSADFAEKTNYDVGYPYVAEMQFRVNGDIVNSDILPKINQIAFEATAYKGLSGTIKKFNYIGEALIPIWNGSDWNTTAKTTNPAAIIRYLLTDSKANPRAISADYIDNDSLVNYYNWCASQGYKASGIISDDIKTLDVINEILKNSQAIMIPLYNGKHIFKIDGEEKTPKGLFNLHNSWDFVWSPNVGRLTEAIKVSYIDNTDYTQTELTVYWYDNAVHEEPKNGTTDEDYLLVKKDVQYCNDRASVLKAVSYELEVMQTKRDFFEFKCNLEALNMTLLDRIYITNSANMQNESTGLIKSVIIENGNLTGFKLYAPVDIPENAQIIIRSLDYDNQAPIITIYSIETSGNSDTVEITPIPYNSNIKGAGTITGLTDTWHYDGDLFTIGQGTIYDCVVTDIRYEEDCTATITARNY